VVKVNDGMIDSTSASLSFNVAQLPVAPLAGVGGSFIDDQDIVTWRSKVDSVKQFYEQPSMAWSPAPIEGSTNINIAYLGEIRDAIVAIAQAINDYDQTTTSDNIPALSWSSIATGNTGLAVKMQEIRNNLMMV
jgi:hypothetical protein